MPAALNFSMTGNPHVNSDIGGFFCGDYNKTYADNNATRNPKYQELYVRGLQFGLFSPMMRSHGTDAFREIYQFGECAGSFPGIISKRKFVVNAADKQGASQVIEYDGTETKVKL